MNLFKLSLLMIAVICVSANAADDLKSYYEKQKAAIAPTFTPPQLGSQVTVKSINGRSRTGILMKLDDASMMLMTDTGNVTYKRMALHESSRAHFFAEDYAHLKALGMTKLYKNDLHKENLAEEAAGMHAGTLYVSAKVEKDSDKKVEKNERENKKTGEKHKTTTTTRSYSETQVLKVGVANSTTHADSYTVDYFFFYKTVVSKNQNTKKKKDDDQAAKEDDNKAVRLLDKGSKRITVDAQRRETFTISSEPCIVEKVEAGNSNSAPKVSGKESAGYLVLLKYGSEILDKKASAKSYLADDWVDKYK